MRKINGTGLQPIHRQHFLDDGWTDHEIEWAVSQGVQSVTVGDAGIILGFKPPSGGILFPFTWACPDLRHRLSVQFAQVRIDRRHYYDYNTGEKTELGKYVHRKGEIGRDALWMPPGVTTPSQLAAVTEGWKDAALPYIRQGVAIGAVPGVGMVPKILPKGCGVTTIFDSDALINIQVMSALVNGGLHNRGRVAIVPGDPTAKRGLTEFVNDGGDVAQLVRDAKTPKTLFLDWLAFLLANPLQPLKNIDSPAHLYRWVLNIAKRLRMGKAAGEWCGQHWAAYTGVAPSIPEDVAREVATLFRRSESTKALARQQTVATALATLKASIPDADTLTHGGYVQLPAGWKFAAMDAGMGAGKTTAMVGEIGAWEGFTEVITSRISLGQQSAIKGNIPHSGDIGIGGEADNILGAIARQAGGLVTQVNSLPRLARQIPKANLTLVLDEAMAALSEAANGGTLGRQKFSDAWEILFSQMRSAKRILLSEANINRATITLVEAITGQKFTVIRHTTDHARFPLKLVSTSSGWWDMLLDALAIHPMRDYPPADQMPNGRHQRVMVATTSKAMADELETIALGAGIPREQILKITGDTNEAGTFDSFWENPDAYLSARNIRLLVITQTGQTGLSIEGDHFDSVFGYGPGFRASTIWQMLGRYRQPVHRYVWTPPFIQPHRHERPTREQSALAANRDVSRWCGKGFNPDADTDQAILNRYIAETNAQAWAEKVAPREALRWMAEQGGHACNILEHPLETEVREAITSLREQAREIVAQRHARQHARAPIDPATHTDDWARDARQRETTYTERVQLRKFDCMSAFPGIDWDSPEIWYAAVFKPRQHEDGEAISGPLAPGARLWAECGAVDLFTAHDRNEAGLVFAKRLVSASIMPTHSVKVALLAPMVPLCEELLVKGQVSPGCPIVKRLAAMARAVSQDLSDYLRITATDDQSDVAIANKILRKFAITVTRQNQCTNAGKRVWIYSVEVPELWAALVEARRKSLESLQGERLGACTKFVESPFNKFGAGGSGDSPPDPNRPTHRWAFMGLDGWLDRVEDGAKAIFRTIAGTIYALSVSDLEAIA